ncbi:C40 family peptidase [Streptomyces tricolor]|nr:C40 family peptidase [Streptomyces tricolor]
MTLAGIEPGDLVLFFDDDRHVGLHVGDGMMVHAPGPGSSRPRGVDLRRCGEARSGPGSSGRPDDRGRPRRRRAPLRSKKTHRPVRGCGTRQCAAAKGSREPPRRPVRRPAGPHKQPPGKPIRSAYEVMGKTTPVPTLGLALV